MGEFRMPSLGADMEAGTLAAWRCQVGDGIARGDVIAEVETDKGIIEVESYESGVVEALLVAEGEKVAVGTPLARIRGAGQPARPVAPIVEPAPIKPVSTRVEVPRASPSARHLAHALDVDVSAVQGTGMHGLVTQDDVRAAAQRKAGAGGAEATARGGQGAETLAAAPPRVRISPLARRRAQALGISLAGLERSFPDGAIHLADVERAALSLGSPLQASGAPPPASAADRMRRAIAASVTRAKREIPHYYLTTTVDLGPATVWLERYNQEHGLSDRVVMGALLLKAVALAARDVPALNARMQGESALLATAVHVGVAISLRGGGLVAPAILDADQKSVGQVMVALADLVKRARKGRLRASEVGEATISVTSLGERGVETVIPVIQPPQVAMVGFGKVFVRPWVVGETIVARPVVTASLAADHRVTDGHLGARFLSAVEAHLQQPEEL